MVEKDKQDRSKRVHEMAEISYAKSSMPSRMQKDLDRKANEPPAKDTLGEHYTFKPKIGEIVTG